MSISPRPLVRDYRKACGFLFFFPPTTCMRCGAPGGRAQNYRSTDRAPARNAARKWWNKWPRMLRTERSTFSADLDLIHCLVLAAPSRFGLRRQSSASTGIHLRAECGPDPITAPGFTGDRSVGPSCALVRAPHGLPGHARQARAPRNVMHPVSRCSATARRMAIPRR